MIGIRVLGAPKHVRLELLDEFTLLVGKYIFDSLEGRGQLVSIGLDKILTKDSPLTTWRTVCTTRQPYFCRDSERM